MRSEPELDTADSLFRTGQFEAALALYEATLARESDNARAHFSRGQALRKLSRGPDAVAALRRAATLKPANLSWASALAAALMEAREIEDAIAVYDAIIARQPDLVAAHANRGVALRMAQQPDAAIEALETALRIAPDPKLHTLLAVAQLTAGRLPDAWRHYEHRVAPKTRFGRGGYGALAWLNQAPVEGKTVLVHAEQGLGDTVMFCRYLALLQDQGAEVLFAPQKPLWPLMRGLHRPVTLVDEDAPGLAFDFHCRLMSLPLAFATTLETIPGPSPYLSAEPVRVEAWRSRLGPRGFKIGVAWRSSPYGVGAGYTFAPELLASLGALPDVRLISLQKADDEFPVERQRALGIELPDRPIDGDGAFLDTAAIMECCDLIIACDGSVANLAGAMARPVWVPLAYNADWRWMTGGGTPWYPTARLFRQPRFGDWEGVFANVEAALAPAIGRPSD